MATQGSNELNALLKAKVVKIMAVLDVNGSLPKIKTQIDEISKKVENKPVKLKVKLDLTIQDLNTQLSALYTKLHESKTAKTPMKLQVQIDVAGSAKNIKKQLADVYKTVQDFNKQYGQQIKQMNQTLNQPNNGKSKGTPFGAVDPALYVQSLKDAEKYMRANMGKNGLFGTTELKNANGNLNGFIASLTKANGVVQKIHYQWNEDAKTFAPINQTTVTTTQKSVDKAKQALMSLRAEIEKLKSGSAKTNLLSQFDDLEKRAGHMTLNSGNVVDLQRQIKEEGVLQQEVKRTNDQFMKQEELVRKIQNVMKADWANNKNMDRRTQLKNLTLDVKTTPNADFKAQELELRRINDQIAQENRQELELQKNTKQRMKILQQIRDIERKTVSNDSTSQNLIGEIKLMAQRAKSAQEWIAISQRMNNLKNSNTNNRDALKAEEYQFKIQQKMQALVDREQMTKEKMASVMSGLGSVASAGLENLVRVYTYYDRRLQVVQGDLRRNAMQSKELLAGGTSGSNHIKSVVNAGDVGELQRYFGEMYRGKVQTVAMKETTNALGMAVTEMKIKMAGAGKEVQTYTVQMNRANGALHQTATGMEYNANRNLGAFEQLRVAMARVPVWMVAMTAFYGTINTIKKMTQEILKLDQALTEIRRVASSNISVDSLFRDAVGLSKELGNNTHDVLAGVAEMARTFGDFNERQLIAITRTATLMSNVSDLTAQEASNNLVGTMNAFNISAEESIHIVDALNEVDNNFAISTKQLAEGLSKSASTAKTFGVGMEEVVGHITAIGAVTMESGAIIGNSLKTIYSRLTTVEGARKAILGVGVAMEDSAGKAKTAEQILTGLAGNWHRMSHEQQQNLAVTVAGRYQLSRFLAMMNNWEMATKATNTAVNSQGSAMRENARYMVSFEARINQLKDGFTEFASAVGDSILSDGLFGIIELLKKMADAGIWVAKNFGALPAVLIPVVAVLGKMGILESVVISLGKLRMLSGTAGIFRTLTGTVSRFNSSMSETMAVSNGTATRTQAIAGAWRSVTVAEAGATVGMRGFAMAMKSALITTGVGALIVGLGFAIEKLIHYFAEQKRKAEELQKMNDKMVKSYRSHRDGMDEMINRYDTLSKKQLKSKDEETEYLKLQKDLANQIPTTVSYIDASGKAHMKNVDEIKREVDAVKQLSLENAKLKDEQFTKNLNKQAENYQKITDKIKDLTDAQSKLVEENGKTKVTQRGYGESAVVSSSKTNNNEAIQQNKVDILMAESEKTEALKKTVKSIQEQSLAWLEANNMMSNLTDEQQSAVENFVSQNESIMRNAKDFKKAYAGIFEIGTQVGTVFSDAMDTYKASLKDSDPQKLMKLDDFKTQMNLVAKSIPDTFFSLTDANGNVVKSSQDVVNGLKEIVNVSHIAETAGKDQAEGLIYRLERTGMSAEDAQGYLWRLADANHNLALRTEASKNMTEEQVGALQDLNEVAMKAIDITSTLFGYTSDDLTGITSRIQAMHVMRDTMGESFKTDERYLQMQQEVADRLGITADELTKHSDKYFKIADGLGKIDWTKYTPDMDMTKFIKEQKDLSPDVQKLLIDWNGAKDIITGALNKTENQVKDTAPKISGAVENIFKNLNFTLPEIDMTRTKASIYFVEDDIGKLQKKVNGLGIDLNKPTGNAMIDGMMGHLQTANGKVTDTQDNMLILRGIINAGIQTGFFDSTGAGADGAKGKIDGAKGSLDIFKQNVQTPYDPNFNPLYQGLDTAKTKAGEAGQAWTVSQSLFSNPMQVNTQPYQTVDLIMQGIKTHADGSTQAVQETVQAGSDVGKISGDIQIVVTQAQTAKDDIQKLNSSLGELGSGFSTGNVNSQLNLTGGKILDVTDKVNGLIITMLNLNTPTVAGMDGLIHQLALLSGNLALATQYGNTTAQAQQAIINAFSHVASTAIAYNSALSQAGVNAGVHFGSMANAIDGAVARIYKAYMRNVNGLQAMVSATNNSLNAMVSNYDATAMKAVSKVDSMTSKMHKAFKDGTRAIVNSAGNLPRDIGNAIRDNMHQASSSMDAVAKDMVKRFKSELGIHSPSRVFTKLGGHVIEGLAKGLSGGNLKELGKDVFKDFGGGVFDSMDMIKAYLTNDFGNIKGGSASAWSAVATKALLMTNQYSPSNLQQLLAQMQTESGGNSKAINLWDSNAKKGIPSKGLMQVIDPTFKSYAMKGYNSNIYDPLSNILASIKYALARYGSLSNAYQGHGYANGGIVDKMELAWHGEEGAEAIIPLIGKRRKRGLQLWEEAGAKLGIDPQALAWLQQFLGKSGGGQSFGGGSSFGASSGEGGSEGGGGDSGASGTIIQSTPTVIGGHNLDGSYSMTALELAKPYTSSYNEKVEAGISVQISLMQTKMEAMNKSSVKYRDTLKQIMTLENIRRSILSKELTDLKNRNIFISKELAKLPALNKQTEAQRTAYNDLNQEEDSNQQKINQLTTDLASAGEGIRKQSIEIFTDLIDEIVSNYDKAINTIKTKVENTDFKINVLQLTNPDDMKALLDAQVEKANNLQSEQATSANKAIALQSQYNGAVSKYGANSEQATKVNDALTQAKKDAKDATLAVLNAEKDIKDTRGKIADESISSLKEYYKNMESMATDAIDKEKADLQKAHDDKMKMYDDESKAITDLYDTKSKQLDKEKAQEDYNSQLADKNAKKAELVNKIALLSRDNSLEGKKKLADLQQQLTDANKDIADTQKQHNQELMKQALEDQKQTQLDAIQANKDTDTQAFDNKNKQLDDEKTAVTKQYEDLINNEQHWADARNEAIKGNFSTISTELQSMTNNINLMNQGIFDNLTKSFSGFSDEVKKQVAEANGLTVDNMITKNKEPISNVSEATKATPYIMRDGSIQGGTATPVKTPVVNTPTPVSTPSKPTSTPTKPVATPSSSTGTEYYSIKKGDSFWDLENHFGLAHGTLAKLNPNVNPSKLQIGQKIVVKKGTSSSSAPTHSSSHGWKTTSALSLRSKAGYSGSIMATMPKGATVEYLGMENGWAKIKYNGKTGYAGKSYLQQFRSGGYTGDWTGDDGKVAVLHKKELVLNERQTENILDTAKIMDKIKSFIPEVSKSSILDKLATASSVVTNITYGDISVVVQGGDKKKATDIAKELMNEIKKKGR